jgi:protein-disulfide isomerase
MKLPVTRLVLVMVCAPLVVAGRLAPGLVLAAQNSDADARFVQAWNQQPRATLIAPPGPGKVVIVKFNDWMCPGCRVWYDTLKPVLAKYQAMPGAIKYVEKDWPWNSSCNGAVQQTFVGHEASCYAAAAVRLAADKGKREQMVEWLYGNQPETQAARDAMPERVKAKVAEMLGVKDFSAAYQSTLPDINKDVAEGISVQIRSTPTYFINGVRAAGSDGGTLPLHYLELGIQEELKKAHK